jgi:hypothetical protein
VNFTIGEAVPLIDAGLRVGHPALGMMFMWLGMMTFVMANMA